MAHVEIIEAKIKWEWELLLQKFVLNAGIGNTEGYAQLSQDLDNAFIPPMTSCIVHIISGICSITTGEKMYYWFRYWVSQKSELPIILRNIRTTPFEQGQEFYCIKINSSFPVSMKKHKTFRNILMRDQTQIISDMVPEIKKEFLMLFYVKFPVDVIKTIYGFRFSQSRCS